MTKIKKVAIFGGGIGGLTVAHELAERGGYSIDVYEKKDGLGGKARSVITKDGYPGEHSVRIVSRTYYHLRDTFSRIPTENGNVLNNVIAPPAGSRKYILFKNYDPCILPSYLPFKISHFKEYWNFLKSLRKIVPLREIISFNLKLMRLGAMSHERMMEVLEKETWDDFLDANNKSEAYRAYLHRLPEFYVAGRGDSNALVMGLLIHKSIFMWMLHPIDTHFTSHDMFNAPTSEAFIDPWVTYLKKLGVNFHTNVSATDIQLDNQLIKSVRVKDQQQEKEIEADFYVFSLPVEIMSKLIARNKQIAETAPSLAHINKLKVEGSSGIQFYVTNKNTEKFPDGWTAWMDSPWSFVGIFQSKKVWKNRELKPPVTGILSVTWSNFDKPGVLYNKPMKECTAEEIKEETLAQLALHRGAEYIKDMQIHTWHIDPELEFDNNSGKFIHTNAPLFIQTPGCYQYQPEAYTEIANLFIAADYVRTSYNITTMEAANEAGRRAANAILRQDQSPHPQAFSKKKPHTGLTFFQFIDGQFYKLKKWFSKK